MTRSAISFTQINLHHAKAASRVLTKRMNDVRTGIALIQEPWINRGKICGLGGGGRQYSWAGQSARACLLVKGLDAELWAPYCDRDTATAIVRYRDGSGSERKLVVASAYFPGDSTEGPPPQRVRDLIRECEQKKLDLVLGCDANSHHLVWGSTDCNARGNQLLEYLAGTNLEILNRRGKPTFRTKSREKVLDLTCHGGVCDGGLGLGGL